MIQSFKEEGTKVDKRLSMEVFGVVEEVFVIFGNFAEVKWCEVVSGKSVYYFRVNNFHGMFPPCGE